MTHYYETLIIIRPTADDEAVQAALTATREHIEAGGGEVAFAQAWGKRKLAYAVADFPEGIYAQLNFTAPPAYPATMERMFWLSEDIIRHLTIRTDGPPPAAEDMPRYLQSTSAEPAPPEDGDDRAAAAREDRGGASSDAAPEPEPKAEAAEAPAG